MGAGCCNQYGRRSAHPPRKGGEANAHYDYISSARDDRDDKGKMGQPPLSTVTAVRAFLV